MTRQGDRLVRAPAAERDLRWYVQAALIGDLPALVAARLRETGTGGEPR